METSRKRVVLSKVAMVLSGYQSGFELVQGSHPGAVETFTLMCSKDIPRLLLPPSRSMMRTALTNFLRGRLSADLIPPFVQIAARVGGPFSRFGTNVSLIPQDGAPSPIRTLIAGVLGRNDFQIALRVSFGRPNAKTVAMAISDAGQVLCFVKIGSEAMTSDLVAHESTVLEQFEDDITAVIMPKRLHSGTWADGHSVLITAPLEQLEPLKRDASLAHVAAAALASQGSVASSALRDSAYWRRILEGVVEYDDDNSHQETLTEIERIWGATEFEFGISHGDWTRANLGLVNGRVAAIDWERSTMLSPKGVDIAHFAISEKTSRRFNKRLDIDQLAETVGQYLNAAGMPSDQAQPLIVFALLEMVIRFNSAQNAGLRSNDSKFGPALQQSVRKWAL